MKSQSAPLSVFVQSVSSRTPGASGSEPATRTQRKQKKSRLNAEYGDRDDIPAVDPAVASARPGCPPPPDRTGVEGQHEPWQDPRERLPSGLLSPGSDNVQDMQLVGKAMKLWDIDPEIRQVILKRIIQKGLRTNDGKLLLRVGDFVLKAEKQNMERERLDAGLEEETATVTNAIQIVLPDNGR